MSSMHNTARIFRYEDFDVALKTYFFTIFRATELLTELERFSGDLWDGNQAEFGPLLTGMVADVREN